MKPNHVVATPVIDHGGAADRLRNHLRRRAITRVGPIRGHLYFLPYRLMQGKGPQGESTFHFLAAEMGDPRLTRVDLPAADLKPFTRSAPPKEGTLVEASRDESAVRARAASLGWEADSASDLIHYPFWNMRVEDTGRQEGAWLDAVEGKIIIHNLKVPSPLPSLKQSAALLAIPSLLLAGVALAPVGLLQKVGVVMGICAAASPVFLTPWLQRRARREREG